MRLSWPRDDDKRRAITGGLPLVEMRASPAANLLFINTTWQDIERHNRLLPQMKPLPEREPSPDLWRQPQQSVSHMDLVHYCKLEMPPCYLSIILST